MRAKYILKSQGCEVKRLFGKDEQKKQLRHEQQLDI